MSEFEARRNRLRDAPLWVHGLAWGMCALATLGCIALFYAYRNEDVWARWLGKGAAAWPAGNETHFGERITGASIFRTPANTVSNLAYAYVGFYVLAYALYDFRRKTAAPDPYAVRQPALMAYFGCVCVLLGFGSGFMHASLTSTGGWYDIYAMFGSLVAIIALHWARWIPAIPLGSNRLPTAPLFIAIAVPVNYALAELHGRFSDIQIMTGLMVTIVAGFCLDIVLRRNSIQHRWYILAAAAFAIAFAIWNLTNASRFVSPDVWYQGHAIWHILTACSLGFMAILYRSELPIASADETSAGGTQRLKPVPTPTSAR